MQPASAIELELMDRDTLPTFGGIFNEFKFVIPCRLYQTHDIPESHPAAQILSLLLGVF